MLATALSRPGRRARRVTAPASLFVTVAAVALSLVPGASAGAATVDGTDAVGTTDSSSETTAVESSAASAAPDLVVVRLRVADRAVERVATKRGTWPMVMLREHGVQTDGNDLVVVRRDGRRLRGDKRRLQAGALVTVVDVRHRTKVKNVRVAPRTVTKATTSLAPGRRKVVAEGRPAVHEVKVKRVLHNDRLVEHRVVSRDVLRPARPRRVLVGRKAAAVPGTAGLNWGALARCESGGNPRAVNPAGYYGLYQFNVATWRGVGGSGMPHHATAAQQTFRAKLLYKSRGRSPWPHCGRYL